jgi:hypothetical protein
VEQPLSASFGVAVYPRDAQDGPDLLRAADRALYTAKRTGRNRVVVAERDGPPSSRRSDAGAGNTAHPPATGRQVSRRPASDGQRRLGL